MKVSKEFLASRRAVASSSKLLLLNSRLMGYLPSTADKCLFLKSDSSERTAFIVWVDDFVFLHEKEETWEKTIARLRQRFTIPAAGPLTCFLGMQIIYSPEEHTMFISQANTIQVLLERSGLANCNPGLIPCQAGSVFASKTARLQPQTAQPSTAVWWLVPISSHVGLAQTLSPSTNSASSWRTLARPIGMLKYLIRYLKGTQSKGLLFKFGPDNGKVHGFADSSHADCPDTSKSTVGYVFYFGGAILSWYSKLHSYVTTCTNHSNTQRSSSLPKKLSGSCTSSTSLTLAECILLSRSTWTALVSCLSCSTRSTTNPTSMFASLVTTPAR